MKLTRQLTVQNKAGFHLRVASMICKESAKYKEDTITLANGSYKADCKSCLDLLAVMAPCGTELTLEVEGENAETIGAIFVEMFEKKFWEDEYSKTG